MRAIHLLLFLPISLLLVASTADAKSCSTFAVVKSFDAAKSTITLEMKKGDAGKFFVKTEGAPNTSKIPGKCKSKVLKQGDFPVKSSGGRLSISQIRENFSGKMLNDPDDPKWLGNELQKLIADKTEIVVVLRPEMAAKDKDEPHWVSTIYMPATDAELKEIERLNQQAEDVE
jgi:hypothetical protein